MISVILKFFVLVALAFVFSLEMWLVVEYMTEIRKRKFEDKFAAWCGFAILTTIIVGILLGVIAWS